MKSAVFGFLIRWRFGPPLLLLDLLSSGNTNGLKLILVKPQLRAGLRFCPVFHQKMADHRSSIRSL